ncbi:unnamed protein product [Paramecium pentaurelia]|uniref:Protein kinase domain-containing protein n=1 Tax=Paramecium pentaurelia TaxID=43138 RepID=A0A8S1XTS4_9CILI|nr:unnamed protein product [Paramecium pentaurelia]
MSSRYKNIDGFIIDLHSQFGNGKFSKCYKCNNQKYRIPQCVKVISKTKELLELFEREIQIIKTLMQIDFKHLVKILHINQQENECYIFMEYCSQGDLDNFINKKQNRIKQLTVEEILSILDQIIQGYKELHQCRIIHRDIKPANILLGNNGYFQIADYGVSKILDNPDLIANQSQIGTPFYAAPQVLIGDNYSNKCDVYSLGVIIYELVYQKIPSLYYDRQNLFGATRKAKDQNILIDNLPPTLRGGTVQEKEKLLKFLNQSLVFEESSRISWEELFKMFPYQCSQITLTSQSNQSSQLIPSSISNQVVSTIQQQSNVQISNQFDNNNKVSQQPITDVQRSNITQQSSIQSYNQSSNQSSQLIQPQVSDIPHNQNPQNNQQQQNFKILIRPIDNFLEKIIEFYMAKHSIAERLFMKNESFLQIIENQKDFVNCGSYISHLQLIQILLSGYQCSIIFNLYHFVFQTQEYWNYLQITNEVNAINRQFLEEQIRLYLNNDTETIQVQQKHIKRLYITQKRDFQKQLKIVQDYQKNQKINFKLEEIIGDLIQNEIFYLSKSFLNQMKIKQFHLYFKSQNENENESLKEHKMHHLAQSINIFTFEEQYSELIQILEFDKNKVIQIPTDEQSIKKMISDYFSNLENNKQI